MKVVSNRRALDSNGKYKSCMHHAEKWMNSEDSRRMSLLVLSERQTHLLDSRLLPKVPQEVCVLYAVGPSES